MSGSFQAHKSRPPSGFTIIQLGATVPAFMTGPFWGRVFVVPCLTIITSDLKLSFGRETLPSRASFRWAVMLSLEYEGVCHCT